MSSASSRYRVFSTGRFRNAPFSKFWSGCTLFGSACLIPLSHFRQYFMLSVRNANTGNQLWKLGTSKFVFLDAKDIVAGCCLIYYMRSLERRMGTKKYINFFLLSTITAISLELMIYSLVNYYMTDIRVPFFVSGPHAILCSCLVQFLFDTPFVPALSIYGMPLSDKCIPSLLTLMLFISSTESMLSCAAGLVSGFLYKIDFLGLSKWSLLPDWLSRRIDNLLEPLQNLGEDHRGRILPLGATVEAQRQEDMDRYEQRMIYEQLRRQHLQDNQRGGGVFLNAARRFFGAQILPRGDAVQQAAVNVPEEKIRTLTDMGFNNRQRVVDVLRRTGNDLNAAAHILLQQEE